jgi:two-component system, cell cycle sensor histidine kinase and response regulator CckA
VNAAIRDSLCRALLDVAFDAVIGMDRGGIVVEFNAAAEQMFGYSREEALGQSLAELIVPADLRHAHQEGLRRYLETGEATVLGRRVRLPALRADGSTFPVELAIARVEHEEPLFAGFIRDLSASVSAEAELKSAETRYRSLVEQLPLVTYINSPAERPATLYISPQVHELLGYPLESWLGADNEFYRSVVHPDDRERVAAEFARSQATGEPFRSEYRLVHAEGHAVWVHDQTSRVFADDGTPLFSQGFLLDITERKQLEERLHQSQKLEAIGQLVGGIAHDFNNMLSTISGYAELLGMSFEAGDERSDDVAELKRAVEHASALTRQLLAFSRKQVLVPQRFVPNEVVSELGAILQRTIGGGITLSCVLEPELGHVEVDRDQLTQVILNLALNARDAMPDGGHLMIATRNVDEESGPHVTIEIADTGCGMSEDVRRRIFEPFFTTKPVGVGTGLGLATAYGVVRQSGGVIDVASEPDVGSVFRVLLPRAPSAVETTLFDAA